MYRIVLLVHIVGVVAFVGTVFSGLLWHLIAARRDDQQVIAHTYHVLNLLDRSVTPASVIVVAVTGVMLARYANLPILGTGWIFWSLMIWSSSGILFALKLLPIQLRLEQEATKILTQKFPSTAHKNLAKKWAFWAHTIFAIIIVALGIMILKPSLPVP